MVTVRLPFPLYKEFKSKCNENYKSMSDVIRDCVVKYIKEKE